MIRHQYSSATAERNTQMKTLTRPLPKVCRHRLLELNLRLPFRRYRDMYRHADYSFLLDSAMDPAKLGRYSFLGGDPFVVYRAKRRYGMPPAAGARIEIEHRTSLDGKPLQRPFRTRRVADPFDDLRGVLAGYAVDYDSCADHPVPLLAGAVGYFGYEAGYFIETLPDRGIDDLAMPDIYLMFVDTLLAHCHRTGKSYLSVLGRGETEDAAERRAADLRDAMLRRIADFESDPTPEWNDPGEQKASQAAIRLKRHFDEQAYVRAVRTVQEHISAGDVFEVCLSHRLQAPLAGGSTWELYQELRRINPAPFACYLSFPEAQVISSSPERFLSLGVDRIAETRPIKGTRPRGATGEEDEKLRHDLYHSEKDRAENVMIVDLSRNDLGRVCKFRTVHVPELMTIEKYATVFQMVSAVRGELRDDVDGLELIKAAFPGGSMTGAPKIEAMKIIDRLEPVKRGIYSGSIGYLDFAGPLDLNIVIRTFIVKDRQCYFNVGGAIVADSDPRGEYLETLDKARALVAALKNLKAATVVPGCP